MHHAYYIEGPLSAFDAYKEVVSPFYAREYERFGIDEARELSAIASLKNYADGVFLLGIASLTSEAQQAMLKLFEEPQEGTQFVLMVPHGMLLPTLKSRMLEYPEKSVIDEKNSLASRAGLRGLFYQQARTFLSVSGKERSDVIAKLLKDDDGVRERVRDFVNALEAELYKKAGEPKVRQGLEDIAMVRQYLGDRSPSLKMLLEHLAVALPTI
ncbi:MAG: hypothetical protein KA066_01615 [Candidatus Pacebacteria bacterium]|nr:hypothetical protein [Candidatus Paceibacterota bacterium]